MNEEQPQSASDEPTQQFKGVWISADLWNDERLTPTAKFLIATIDSLCGPKGPCFASVEYLAQRLHLTVGSMKNLLVKLTESKHLIRVGSDGRKTWRCPNPRYWSDQGMAKSWSHIYMTSEVISSLRGHKNMTSEVINKCSSYIEREIRIEEEGAEAPPSPGFGSLLPKEKKEGDVQPQPLNGHTKPPRCVREKVARKPFVPPTPKEFAIYAKEKGISMEDARSLFEQWEAGDPPWHDGAGNPIRGWKQKLLRFRDYGWLPSDKRARNEETNNNQRNGKNEAWTRNVDTM